MLRAGKIIGFFVLLVLPSVSVFSQACSTLGQNPGTAFPVCGTNIFVQTSVPTCGGTRIPTPCNDGGSYSDVNPFWYKFTCYTTGTLGFVITPKNQGDDYDWELFDITGRNPQEVYTDASLIVSANWSGSPGNTGASPAGRDPFECASNPSQNIPTFSNMPTIIAGHDYLLLISHFDGANQSGYTLSYPSGAQGGTGSIVNPLTPAVTTAYAVCDGTQIVLKLNKKVNCSSLATDGTDFTISGPVPISIASASGTGCNNGFDTDTILLKLNSVLSPGTYSVLAKAGTDGNTLTDNCANSLATGSVASLKFTASQPTPMDSISPVVCIKDTLQLVFSKPINCSSIAADGSDFLITGPVAVSVKSAAGTCSNGVSTIIRVLLTAPIRVNGTFTIHLQNGSDGNTLVDECGQATPAGSLLPFVTKNITKADFTNSFGTGCTKDSLRLSHDGNNGANQWQWMADSVVISTAQNTSFISKTFGSHLIQLFVSNGKCTDTASVTLLFSDQTVKAAFSVSSDTLCPNDTLHLTDQSSSNAITWQWDLGNGASSNLQAPGAQSYPAGTRSADYLIRLLVKNSSNCADSAYRYIYVMPNCYIAVATAFTPNGDGLNDYLYPLNAYKAANLLFRVYNRSGQVIFETRNWNKKWDGRLNGQPQPSGTYVWTLDYTDTDKQQKVSLKGTTVLIR